MKTVRGLHYQNGKYWKGSPMRVSDDLAEEFIANRFAAPTSRSVWKRMVRNKKSFIRRRVL